MGDTIRPSDPLWLILSANDRFIQRWVSRVSGVLVDLGCGRQPYRSWMSGARTYVGIDLPPGRGASIEQIRAEVHADLYQSVPLRDASADVGDTETFPVVGAVPVIVIVSSVESADRTTLAVSAVGAP